MKRIAVFASGEGSNFEAIAAACERGAIAAEVALVVCDRPGARVTERAAARGIACFAFAPKEYASKADYEREIVARLDAAGVELVCLAGYMRIVGDVLLGAYGGRIINIHPSLLPAFRGAHAIEQALEYGVNKARNDTVQTIRARGLRPSENGASGAGAAVQHKDVASLTREERAQLMKRALRGESIDLK